MRRSSCAAIGSSSRRSSRCWRVAPACARSLAGCRAKPAPTCWRRTWCPTITMRRRRSPHSLPRCVRRCPRMRCRSGSRCARRCRAPSAASSIARRCRRSRWPPAKPPPSNGRRPRRWPRRCATRWRSCCACRRRRSGPTRTSSRWAVTRCARRCWCRGCGASPAASRSRCAMSIARRPWPVWRSDCSVWWLRPATGREPRTCRSTMVRWCGRSLPPACSSAS